MPERKVLRPYVVLMSASVRLERLDVGDEMSRAVYFHSHPSSPLPITKELHKLNPLPLLKLPRKQAVLQTDSLPFWTIPRK